MSKYNFAVDEINPNSTHGKILSQIKEGSTVLECGCATGYMTRFMKQKMNCTVDIIEVDEEAFNIAMMFANDGFCGSLDEIQWYNHFYGKQYDYILFADVLEHLHKPLQALDLASGLLKKDGKVIFSIPNICHNDIIIRMFNDSFTMTTSPIPILDFWMTHISTSGVATTFRDSATRPGLTLRSLTLFWQRQERRSKASR